MLGFTSFEDDAMVSGGAVKQLVERGAGTIRREFAKEQN
jgi:hypothetical protein